MPSVGMKRRSRKGHPVEPAPGLAWLEGLGDVVLAALRDALLRKLLSAEIRIKDAERIAGEVA